MTRPERVSQLGKVINRRRIDLDMTWREVERAADLSYEGLRGIRRGDRNPSELTARRLEDALGWEHGSINAILDGNNPTPVDAQPRTVRDRMDRRDEILGEIMERLREYDELTERDRSGPTGT